MGSRPLSTTLLTALALWALWLWERHKLLKISPEPTPPAAPVPGGWPFPPGAVPLPGTVPRSQGGAPPVLPPVAPWVFGGPQ